MPSPPRTIKARKASHGVAVWTLTVSQKSRLVTWPAGAETKKYTISRQPMSPMTAISMTAAAAA